MTTEAMTTQAEWTVMVFLNGKNDLVSNAFDSFHELANVGSTDEVNILVQFGWWETSDKNTKTNTDVIWPPVLRFRVTKQTVANQQHAVQGVVVEQDMGSASALADFLDWGRKTYPANHYALIIWSHGQGWRLMDMLADDQSQHLFEEILVVSQDDEKTSRMYTREIQDELSRTLAGARLDLLGMDACLMGGIENAYAFRNLCDVYVASKEDVPATSWPYELWLGSLTKAPKDFDANKLGTSIVGAYRQYYDEHGHPEEFVATLSAIEASAMNDLGRAVNDFAVALIAHIHNRHQRALFVKVREGSGAYGHKKTTIDLGHLLAACARGLQIEPAIRESASRALSILRARVTLDRYQEYESRTKPEWSGLSIYFPKDRSAFLHDLYASGYIPGNPYHPVEFVDAFRWAPLLLAYLAFLEES